MFTPAAVSVVRRAVRSSLAAEDGRPDGWRWRGGVPAEDFLDAAERHRVTTLLASHTDRLGYPADLARDLAARRARDRLEAMGTIHAVRTVHERLAGIDHLFLKGPALAVQTTGDPTARGTGDVDVVVRPAQLGDAVDALLAAGWTTRPGYTTTRPSWAWRHQLRTTCELVLDHAVGSVDLHWRQDPTYGGLPDFEEVWARHVTVDLGVVAAPTLAPRDAFAHSLRHAAKDRWDSLRSLVDIHRLAADPATWPAEPDRLERMSLSVTDATIGLPPSAPGYRATPTGIPQALRTQARAERTAHVVAENSLRTAQYVLRSSRSPRDLGLLGANLLFPPMLTWTVEGDAALPAVASAARARLSSALHRRREEQE